MSFSDLSDANILTAQARVKISDVELTSTSDFSDEPFRINYPVGSDQNDLVTEFPRRICFSV